MCALNSLVSCVLGRCELCKTKFRFDPQYAENTPDRLPSREVVLGLLSRFLAKWLPLALRILTAAMLWLVLAPLLTACLYHGWMHRPSSILTRWSRELILADIVSGAIIVGIIIISFLSLMSFADFLRVHWQQPERENGAPQRRNGHANDFEDGHVDINEEEFIDNSILEFVERCHNAESALDSWHDQQTERDPATGANGQHARYIETVSNTESTFRLTTDNMDQYSRNSDQVAGSQYGDSDSDEEYVPGEDSDEEDDIELDDEFEEDEGDLDVEDEGPPNGAGNGNGGFDPLDPNLQDDQMVSTEDFSSRWHLQVIRLT